MKKWSYAIIISLLILSLCGCGGGGSSVSTITPGSTVPSVTAQTGTLKLIVKWPDNLVSSEITGQVIQPVVNSITVRVTSGGTYDQSQTINSPTPGGTEEVTFTAIPTGTASVEATGRNAANTVISHKMQNETIGAYATTVAYVHLGVSIRDTDFYPSTIPISVNDTLYWVNNDTVSHTLTITDSNGTTVTTLGPIAAGASTSYQFNATGTYTCTSSVVGFPTGTIQVYQNATTGNMEVIIDK